MSFPQTFYWTLFSIPLTVCTVMFCVFLMGGGHGTYTPTIYLFPYAMLTSLAEDMIGPLSIVLGLVQFVTYGLVVDLTKGTKRRLQVGTILILLHGLAIVLVLINKGDAF